MDESLLFKPNTFNMLLFPRKYASTLRLKNNQVCVCGHPMPSQEAVKTRGAA